MTTKNTNFYLDAEYEQAEAGRDTAAAKIKRLLEAAFEDKARAIGAFNALRDTQGMESAIQKLTGKGQFVRWYHFGPMKGDLLVKGNREEARNALDQLPDAIRTHQALADICSDLKIAKREAAERQDRQRLAREGIYADHTPKRGRLH